MSCNNKTDSLTTKQSAEVKAAVQQMVDVLAKDITREGPVAWLRYFENTPNFFMASDGQLVFPNNDSATAFIKNSLVRQIPEIELHGSNIRIDPLTGEFANVAANFHEDLTDLTENKTSQYGYFTAIAERTSQGWKLRNAHWSIAKSK